MIDGVGALTKAISVLRSQLATSASRARAGHGKGATTGSQKGDGYAESHVATLAARLAAIPSNEPKRSKVALRLFVEAVLLDDFGGKYVLAPDFQVMVDKVASALEDDPELGSCLKDAVGELTAGANTHV
jgi:hypothetical protein